MKDIPTNTTTIPQKSVLGTAITSSVGMTDYMGPTPPSGTHRYFFTIYALDIKKITATDSNNFMDSIKGHILD